MNGVIRKRYEKEFCDTVGAVGARAFALGRQAMVVLLKSLGVREGDKIGVCGYTCLSVAEAVKVCGAKPVYIDVDNFLCMDPQEIRRHEKNELKIVILQHTFGVPGQLGELLTACEKIGAKVIEDCSHALGCTWKDKPLGQFGEGAIYSFEWGKPYTTGQGGMLTVNSAQMLEKVNREIERYALPSSKRLELILNTERLAYYKLGKSKLKKCLAYFCNKVRKTISESNFSNIGFHMYPGYVRLAGEMTCKIGLKQLEGWPKLMQLRQSNTEMIEEHLSRAGLALCPRPDDSVLTLLRYRVATPNKLKVLEEFRKKQLDVSASYLSPVHPLKGNELYLADYKCGSCARSENAIDKFIYLPTGPSLNKRDLATMIQIICSN